MATEAQIAANRQNALLSTGPKTLEGKERSRQNALQHGLTGEGVVLSQEAAAEVDRRLAAFRAELKPAGEVAETLVRRASILSVRMDRSVSHETARLAERIRQVEADFVAPEGADPATVEQLRAEARDRALFDDSKAATLVRKYEAAAERSFFRALKELRQLQKQAQAPEPTVQTESLEEILASFSQLNAEVNALESRRREDDRRPSSTLAKRPTAPLIPTQSARVDVPITIGRPR